MTPRELLKDAIPAWYGRGGLAVWLALDGKRNYCAEVQCRFFSSQTRNIPD